MTWSAWFDLTSNEVANEAPTTCGVFCIARKASAVAYPAGSSPIVFVGAATDWQRGLRAVLAVLAAGQLGALELERGEGGPLRFCFQANLGDDAARLRAAIIDDFAQRHGAPPRCNGVAA